MRYGYGFGFGRSSRSLGASATGDVRQTAAAAGLLGYWESRPAYVPEASASLTLAATLLGFGTTPPVATISGSFAPRQMHFDYPVGGAVDGGVATFRCNMGDGKMNGPTGLVTSTPVAIGGGAFVSWAAGTVNTNNRHYAVVQSWNEIPLIQGNAPRATFKWDDNLSPNNGPIYEAYGQSSKDPALLSAMPLDAANCLLENRSGVPGLATGVDTPIQVAIGFEHVFIPTGNVAPRLFSFNGVAAGDTSAKNGLGLACAGNTLAGANNQYLLERHDNSSGAANLFSLAANKDDTAPHVAICDYVAGQLYLEGMPICTLTSLNRGVTSNFGRCTLFGRKCGTAAVVANELIHARIWAVAMGVWTAPQRLIVAQTLAGVGLA